MIETFGKSSLEVKLGCLDVCLSFTTDDEGSLQLEVQLFESFDLDKANNERQTIRNWQLGCFSESLGLAYCAVSGSVVLHNEEEEESRMNVGHLIE